MPLLGWLLFLQISAFLFLVPTVLNVWSLVLALKLYRLDRAEPPQEAYGKRLAVAEEADSLRESEMM
jgi:hypothetical protein